MESGIGDALGAPSVTEEVAQPPRAGGRIEAALDAAFARETRRGVLLIAIYEFALSGFDAGLQLIDLIGRFKSPFQFLQNFTLVGNCVMAISALVAYVLALRSRRPLIYAYALLLLVGAWQAQTTFLILWRPAALSFWPTYLSVRFQDVLGVSALVATSALPISSALLLRVGAAAAVIWSAAVIVAFLTFPGSHLYLGPLGPRLGEAGLARISNPFQLIPDYLVIQVLLLIVLTALLTATVDQSHRYVVARVRTEIDLAFLRRLLPSDVAERVVDTGDGRLHPVRREVAVLFVGCQGVQDAAANLAELRAHFAEVERAAFSHGGMVDRFTGGPIMVTFGALDPAPDAARRAVDCSRVLSAGFAPGGRPLSMAAHVGEAVCGEAGGARSRVFSVVGDVVNTARRILDQADPGVMLTTDEVVKALGHGAGSAGFSPLGQVRLRGREAGIMLWRMA